MDMNENDDFKIVAIIPAYQGHDFLTSAIDSIYSHCYKIIIAHSLVSWKGQNDSIGNTCLSVMTMWKKINDWADKIVNISGKWDNQHDHYNYLVSFARKHYGNEADAFLVQDTDEIWDDENLLKLINHIKEDKMAHDSYSCKMFTYLKSPYWRVEKTEPCSPIIILNPKVEGVTGVRCNRVGNRKHFEDVKYHHMCYVRADDRTIHRKFKSIQVADGVPSENNWINDIYNKLDSNTLKTMINLHPTRGASQCWNRLILIKKSDLPIYLQKNPVLDTWDEKTGEKRR